MGVVVIVEDKGTSSPAGSVSPMRVASADVNSWAAHSSSQLLEFGTPAYYEGYQRFIAHRVIVEQVTFGISEVAATLTAQWLAISAQRHDEAEHLFDTQGESAIVQVRALWLQVSEALEIRYLIKNITLEVQHSSAPINVLKEMANLVDLKAWVRENLSVSAESLIAHSRTEATAETEQWQAHHTRDYDKFSERTRELLILYGLPEAVARKGANFLILACQQHDEIEERMDGGRPTTEQEIQALWQKAVCYMDQYYRVIMHREVAP